MATSKLLAHSITRGTRIVHLGAVRIVNGFMSNKAGRIYFTFTDDGAGVYMRNEPVTVVL